MHRVARYLLAFAVVASASAESGVDSATHTPNVAESTHIAPPHLKNAESSTKSTQSAESSADSATHTQEVNSSIVDEFLGFCEASDDDRTLSPSRKRCDAIPKKSPQDEFTPLSLFYNASFGYLLDNIEETTPFWQTRTIHAIWASLQGGFSVEDDAGAHNIVFGGYGAQFMGARNAFNATGGIFAYYHYAHKNDFNAYLGIFPRKAWISTYPRSFFRDDYLFLTPQISGALLQYKSDENPVIQGYAEASFEHFGANLKERRDEFYALFGGEVKVYETLAFGAQGALYHHQDEGVVSVDGGGTFLVDRALYSAYIGFDMRGFARVREIFDAMELKVALLGQSERKRTHSGMLPFYNAIGGEVSAKAQYRGFGVEDIYYFGAGQMRYFGDYGERFYAGLPLYRGAFNTISAFYEYKNDFLSVRAGFRFYNIGKRLERLAHQQFVNFSFDLDRLLKKRKIAL